MTITDEELRDRTRSFLDEHDHNEMSMHEFRGVQFDAGLALVHFPEGKGGLGLSRGKQAVVDELSFGASNDDVADRLEAAIADVTQAVAEMRAGAVEPEHYER